MEQLLWIRENIIHFYKRFETVILFAVKLIAAMVIFQLINSIGLWREELAPLYTAPLDFPFFMLSALLFAILPPTAGHVFLLVSVLAQISQSLEVAAFVFLLLLLVIAFYGRIAPKMSYLIIAMVIAFRMNMPYAVVIFAGLYLGMTSVIPIAIGTGLAYFLPFFATLADNVRTPAELDLIAMPMTFLDLYTTIYEALTTNIDWVVWAFVLAMAVLAVYAISRLSIRYAKDIAIGAGALVILLGLGIAGGVAGIDIPMGSVFGGTFSSLILVFIIRFFDSILDYKKVERVQFEDEENCYYVKVVPKIVGRHPGEVREEKSVARTAVRERVSVASAARPPREPRVSSETRVLERRTAESRPVGEGRPLEARSSAERRPVPDARPSSEERSSAPRRPVTESKISEDTIIRPRVVTARDTTAPPPVRRPAPKPDVEIADMVFDDESKDSEK